MKHSVWIWKITWKAKLLKYAHLKRENLFHTQKLPSLPPWVEGSLSGPRPAQLPALNKNYRSRHEDDTHPRAQTTNTAAGWLAPTSPNAHSSARHVLPLVAGGVQSSVGPLKIWSLPQPTLFLWDRISPQLWSSLVWVGWLSSKL